MNPFRILELPGGSSSQEILLAVTRALQKKAYSVREIAEAQKELMNPRSRQVAEFLYFISLESFTEDMNTEEEFEPSFAVPLLSIFDTL